MTECFANDKAAHAKADEVHRGVDFFHCEGEFPAEGFEGNEAGVVVLPDAAGTDLPVNAGAEALPPGVISPNAIENECAGRFLGGGLGKDGKGRVGQDGGFHAMASFSVATRRHSARFSLPLARLGEAGRTDDFWRPQRSRNAACDWAKSSPPTPGCRRSVFIGGDNPAKIRIHLFDKK